ncbi:MAG: hypothetical protein HUU21_22565 [Polyangiaceae bacterium]|nr:hypothetical protein [Polyangiaceae bacterium]
MTEITESTNSAAAAASREDEGQNSLLVVDIGKKQPRKRIRDLRKGKGRLFRKVHQVIDEMRANGAIDENAKPIVIVVRQKTRSGLGWKL